MVAHACNASTWKAGVEGSELDHRPWLLGGLKANRDYMVSHHNKTKQEEKAQQTKALAAKPDYLNQIPGIYTVEGKSQRSKAVLRPRMATWLALLNPCDK